MNTKASPYPRIVHIMNQVIPPQIVPEEILGRVKAWCEKNGAWIVRTDDLWSNRTVTVAWGRDDARELLRLLDLRINTDGIIYAAGQLYKSPSDGSVMNTVPVQFKRKVTEVYEFTERELEGSLDLIKGRADEITEDQLKVILPSSLRG